MRLNRDEEVRKDTHILHHAFQNLSEEASLETGKASNTTSLVSRLRRDRHSSLRFSFFVSFLSFLCSLEGSGICSLLLCCCRRSCFCSFALNFCLLVGGLLIC